MGLPHPRPYFGYEKAISLLELLENYRAQLLDVNRFAFVEGLSVLGAYLEFTDNNMEQFMDRYRQIANGIQKCAAGNVSICNIQEVYDKFDTNQVEQFILSRHSIRSYIKEPVKNDVLQKVITLANHAPSACNRQPTKVYVTSNPDSVNKISALVPGNNGFEDEVPNWMIITTDRWMFGVDEPMQWYVNGGIYLSYLVEALHAYHLGSCIFQIPGIHPNSIKLRTLLSLPMNESIIAAVGFGYPRLKNKVLVAERRPVNEVLVRI